METIVKSPGDCSQAELAEFYELALASGEVQKEGLADLVEAARALGFLRVGGSSIGIAGLKCPRAGYRDRVFANAKSKNAARAFPFELGWAYIMPEHQGRGHSLPLVRAVLACAGTSNVYATSKTCEDRMHRTLARCNFAREGFAWVSSRRRDEELLLFARLSSNPRGQFIRATLGGPL